MSDKKPDSNEKVANPKGKAKKLFLKTAKGTRDRDPQLVKITDEIFDKIKTVFKRHGAVSIDTPVFELKEILSGKYGEDSKLIYDLQDQGGELLALRYDLTVPFARYVAMKKIKQIKRYQIGKVYRRDQPVMTKGRFREFFQCDFDIAGQYNSCLPDAECLKIIHEILSDLDLGNFEIKVNHRKILDGLFEICGVPGDKFTAACSCVDKLDKVSWCDVRTMMIEEKKLDADVVEKIGQYVKLKDKQSIIDLCMNDESFKNNKSIQEGLKEMTEVLSYCELFGIQDTVIFDLSLARGLDYYTGIDSLEIKEKNNKDPDQDVPVGSVAGGGRYDNLVGMFDSSNQKVPCVGVSFGIERLLAIKYIKTKEFNVRISEVDFYVCGTHSGLMQERIKIAQMLWNDKISMNPKLLDQLQYCENNFIPYAIIVGSDELSKGKVKLRKVETREEEEIDISTMVETLKKKLVLTSE